MVSHFKEQLEQMNHQAIPQIFKSILAHRHSVSCLICVVHLSRHVKKYVIWKVYLLKCASLIMVFPSISVSPHPFHPPPTPVSWIPYLFGAGCFAIKTPWWVLLLPSLAPSAACNCIHRHSTPPLPLICLLVYFQHIPQSLCHHSSGEPPVECVLFSLFFLCLLLVVFFANPSIFLCMLSFCSRMIVLEPQQYKVNRGVLLDSVLIRYLVSPVMIWHHNWYLIFE